MPFVLDSSVALAWVLPDEHGTGIDEIANRLETDNAVAPAVWPFEIVNALLMATRRARITEKDLQQLLDNIGALPVEIEPVDPGATLDAISRIAVRHGLTSYDAAYIELAARRNIPLATLDKKLREASSAEAVSLLPKI